MADKGDGGMRVRRVTKWVDRCTEGGERTSPSAEKGSVPDFLDRDAVSGLRTRPDGPPMPDVRPATSDVADEGLRTDGASEELARVKVELNDVTERLRQVSCELDSMRRQRDERAVQLSQVRFELDDMREQCAELTELLHNSELAVKERNDERVRLDGALASTEGELRVAKEQVAQLKDELHDLRECRYLETDERIRKLQGDFRAELTSARADAELRQAEFKGMGDKVKQELRASANDMSSRAFKEVDRAIENLGTFREQLMGDLRDWQGDVLAKEFSGLGLFVQFFYRILGDLKREAELLPPDADELSRAIDAMQQLTVRLEDGCGELGLRFKWARPGDPFNPGIAHDLLSEDERPDAPEGAQLYVSECVAPEILIEIAGGRERRLRRAVVRISTEANHD